MVKEKNNNLLGKICTRPAIRNLQIILFVTSFWWFLKRKRAGKMKLPTLFAY